MALSYAGATLVSSARLLSRVWRAWQPGTPSLSYRSITAGRVHVNGANLNYLRTGHGDHAVLLLPGFIGISHADFESQLKFLNKEIFTVIGWDPRGYGHSIPPVRDYPPDYFSRDAKDAVDLMQALNFKKFSMLGWSDGGITALVAAASYSSLINKLVVWGANAYITEEDLALYTALKDATKWSPKIRGPLEDFYGKEYFANTVSAWVEAMTHFTWKCDGNLCKHLLPLIGCPTLIIHGMKDPLVPLCHAEFLHEQVKNSRLHLMPEGKHNLHQKYSEEFNRLVENFLCPA